MREKMTRKYQHCQWENLYLTTDYLCFCSHWSDADSPFQPRMSGQTAVFGQLNWAVR